MTRQTDTPQSDANGVKPGHLLRPVVLCILDGWGHSESREDNAIAQASTPVWDRLTATVPTAFLDASAGDVGLPAGQMGNSEVGHMNLGAGRIVMQDLPRIDAAIAQDQLKTLPPFQNLIAAAKTSRTEGPATVHLMGLLSPGGVHAHQLHLVHMAQRLSDAGIAVAIHAFLDGRDTPPQSAADYVREVETALAAAPLAKIATVTGRFFAMDRDQRWDRVQQAYDVIVSADAPHTAPSAADAIAAAAARGESDEFVTPTVIAGYQGIADGDGLLMGNFRADRAREILTALLDPAFDDFSRQRVPTFSAAVGLTEYSTALNGFLETLFPAEVPENVLGHIVSRAGGKQLRIAETEKYAHVTFFLNGGREEVFEGEDRILVPSPKVATYDLQPEMAAAEVTDKLVDAIDSGRYDLIVVNYANTDMVGHTGILSAAIAAVETVDRCLGRLEQAVLRAGGAMFVTADHGNAEKMRDAKSDAPHTAHTSNPVPVRLIGTPPATILGNGRLSDVAPTLLALMGLPQPAEMTGRSLLKASDQTSEEPYARTLEKLGA